MKRREIKQDAPVYVRIGGRGPRVYATVVEVRARNRHMAPGDPDRVKVQTEGGRELYVDPRHLSPREARANGG